MATKDPQKKLLIAAIKKTIKNNCVLPTLDCVMIDGEYIEFSDLETTVSMPFKIPKLKHEVLIPSTDFIDCLEMMDNPGYEVEKTLVPGCAIKADSFDFKVKISEGSRKVSVTGEDPDNFPIKPLCKDREFVEIGAIEPETVGDIQTALKFVSDNALRPSMTGIHFADHIAATDAHRLFFKPISPVMESFILPEKTAKILLVFGSVRWQVFAHMHQPELQRGMKKLPPPELQHVAFLNEAGVLVTVMVIDARFPDWKVVVPDIKDTAVVLTADREEMLQELKNAKKFANRSTNMVILHMNGDVKIESRDIDAEKEYQNKFKKAGASFLKNEKPLSWAGNANFLEEIISIHPKNESIKINFFSETKCGIINNHFLIMPLMINS